MSSKRKPALRSSTDPWLVRALELLEDGEWHDYEEVMAEVMAMVPPGVALRHAEDNRVKYYTRRGMEPEERKYGDLNSSIRSGQRMIVRKGLNSLKKSGRIEVEYRDPSESRKRLSRLKLTEAEYEIRVNPATRSRKASTPSIKRESTKTSVIRGNVEYVLLHLPPDAVKIGGTAKVLGRFASEQEAMKYAAMIPDERPLTEYQILIYCQ